MRSLPYLLLTTIILPLNLWAQVRGQPPTDTAMHAVAYVAVMPSARGTAVAALKQYRDASRKDEGYVRLELFEQIGLPTHFAIVETWTDQKAFEAHGKAAHTKQLLGQLQSIRLSDYDQRPYKTFATTPPSPTVNGRTIHVLTHVDIAGAQNQTEAPGLLRRQAETSRKDEGSLSFEILQHAARGNHFTIVEAWQNQKALDAHAAATHTREYRDTLAPMTGSPVDERIYKVVD